MAVADVIPQLQAALGGRYTIERELGRGGWATVYQAHDHKHDRKVAVKVLRPEVATALGSGRFLREISIAGRLIHPHILPLYDSGAAGDSLYYVMPYVTGETLRQRLQREHQLPLADTLAIARQVADALAFAHARNVVHRDIKPENILLEGDQVYVADFGIARAMLVAAGETLSSPGIAVGTPAYMSPEQAGGDVVLDGRSDLYSLACVVYEMLAGEPPHTGATAQAILARQQTETPRSIRVLRPMIPQRVEQTILMALAKSAADRHPSVSDFVTALAEGAVPGRREDQRPWGRSRTLALGAALVLGLGSLVWLARSGPASGVPARSSGTAAEPTHVAVLYFDDLSEGGELGAVAGGLTEDLIDALSQVPALHVVSPNGVRPYLHHPAPPDSIGRALRVGSLVGGSVERAGDVLRVRVRLIDAASGRQLQSRALEYPYDSLFTLQAELAQEVSGFLRERLGREILLREGRKRTRSVAAWELMQEGEASREAARMLRTQGDTAAGERALDAADSLFARAADLDSAWPDPSVLRGWVTLDRIVPSEHTDSIVAWFRTGMRHASRALELRPGYLPALELRGTLRFRNWLATGREPAEARQAEEDLRAGAVPANPSYARAWGTLSALLQARGQLAEANLLARRAYEADAFLAETPDLLFRLYHTSVDVGKEDEAAQWCETGKKRFPADWQFTYCELGLLALPDSARTPRDRRTDVARAWELVSQLERLSPVDQRAVGLPRWQMRVAGVLASAGLADSAEAVIRRARAAAPDDPEMDFHEAEARMLLGDREAVLRLLARDVEANPQFKNYVRAYPGFRPLWKDPRFQAMVR